MSQLSYIFNTPCSAEVSKSISRESTVSVTSISSDCLSGCSSVSASGLLSCSFEFSGFLTEFPSSMSESSSRS